MTFKKSKLLHILWIAPFGFLIYLFLQYDWMFHTNRYEENTPFHIQNAHQIFENEVNFKLPKDSELIQGSEFKFGPNFITNLFFRVPDIETFSHKTLTQYSYDIGLLKYPYFDGDKIDDVDYNIYLVPFCEKEEFYKDTLFDGVMKQNLLKDFCTESEAMITQIHNETEIGVLMGIIPSKNIVWLNYTGWF